MTNLLNIILGIFIGITTNLISWWILFHGLSPTILFSPAICKTSRDPTSNDKSKYVFRARLENSGRRAIIDFEVMVRLHLKGLEGYPKGLSQIVYIPLDSSGNIVHKIPHIPRINQDRSKPIIIFCTYMQSEFTNPNNYPKSIVNKAKNKTLLIEDVLKLGDGTYFEIIGFGFDSFSGSRKYFISKRYTILDIQYGNFKEDGLDIIPIIAGNVTGNPNK
jgi:hypothetical protein